MILLAMALLAQDYGKFDVEQTREICRAKIEGNYKEVYPSIEDCIDDHRVDYRHFTLLAEQSDPMLAPAFRACVKEWTAAGRIDWGMADYCAVDVVNGKRDYDMFLEAAPNRRVRAAIRACRKYWIDEDTGVVDWDMTGDCAGRAAGGGKTYSADGGDVVILTEE